MHPSDALSPKWRIEDGTIRVIYVHPSTDWSIATMVYDNHPAVGIRWNGDINDRDDLGYPSARGKNGAWFILPDEVSALVVALIGAVGESGVDVGQMMRSALAGSRINQPQALPN